MAKNRGGVNKLRLKPERIHRMGRDSMSPTRISDHPPKGSLSSSMLLRNKIHNSNRRAGIPTLADKARLERKNAKAEKQKALSETPDSTTSSKPTLTIPANRNSSQPMAAKSTEVKRTPSGRKSRAGQKASPERQAYLKEYRKNMTAKQKAGNARRSSETKARKKASG